MQQDTLKSQDKCIVRSITDVYATRLKSYSILTNKIKEYIYQDCQLTLVWLLLAFLKAKWHSKQPTASTRIFEVDLTKLIQLNEHVFTSLYMYKGY